MLSRAVATWCPPAPWAANLNELRLNKTEIPFLSCASHTANAQWPRGLVATVLDRAHAERSRHHGESCWTAAGRNVGFQMIPWTKAAPPSTSPSLQKHVIREK